MKHARPIPVAWLALAIVSLIATASTAEIKTAPEKLAFFEKRIRPVLIEHCYECHATTSDDLMGGLLLDSPSGWKKGGDSGPAIVPGKPQQSLLLEAMSHRNPDLQMPPDNRLPQAVVDDFHRWIADGAVDPRAERASKQTAPLFDLAARKAEHWAWQPVSKLEANHSVDHFIDARLAGEGIVASPQARPRVLIRRLSFDLIGLPPTIAEIDHFSQQWTDNSDAAVAELVDRLLADRRHGEHWARHWLDVVRYSETKGHVTDQPRPFAWKYRDYVIDSINDDLPYDRFVIEHLAGDLLPPSESRANTRGDTNVAPTATGALFMHEMHFMAVDPVKQRWDEVNAQIDMVSKAFLGLTLECARCHDHKFDAVSQRDYYALAGFFQSTEQSRVRTSPRQVTKGPKAKQIAGLEANYRKFLNGKRKARFKAQKPKAGGEYFPVSEELGIQSPGDTNKLLAKMRILQQADPSWEHWVRGAKDIDGRDAPLLIRGESRKKGDLVPRQFLAALSATPPTEKQLGPGSGRLWLAQRIVDPDNPLTARVWANRLWHHLLGRGIVATPSNFGKLGAEPTHPKLLDYLANRLISQEWSTKAIIREIVLSRAYRRSSKGRVDLKDRDPENLLLARSTRRRLTAEQLRDSMLLVSGSMDPVQFGPSVECYIPPYATANKPSNIPRTGPRDGNNRRSIYLRVRRNFYDPFLQTFDFPEPGKSVGRRAVTITPSQSLAMLNSLLVHELAADWGKRLSERSESFDQRLQRMWIAALGREPTSVELQTMRAAADELRSVMPKPDEALFWKDLAHIVFNHADFAWID